MRTFTVTKEVEFDAGHRVPLHESACYNPHGHRYRVAVTVEGPVQDGGSSTGMVIDFSHIKAVLTKRVHDVYDHSFIVWEGDELMRNALSYGDATWKVNVVDWHPTAENMAADIFADLQDPIECMADGVRLVNVQVWETPTSVACYGESS
jgi:6-pyruvoyltetrahydropterin/6-carboxytetrahydropterin synthase